MADLFEQLQEFKWRDISFPASTFSVHLRHSLATHRYPNVDGANVEATGRDELVFRARIPFYNGVVPGKGETFGILYPETYRKFLAAMADKSTGKLQHPELGLIECKPEECNTEWAADRRDGVTVDVTWVETEDQAVDTNAIFNSDSPITNVSLGALDLDASLGLALDQFPTLPKYQPDFAATMRSITAISDQVSLLSQRVKGKLDGVAYRVENLSNSISKARSSVLTAKLGPSTERLKAGIIDLRKTLGTTGKTIVFEVVRTPMTLANVAQNAGAPIVELIKLNNDLVREPVVAAGTIVRHYKTAA